MLSTSELTAASEHRDTPFYQTQPHVSLTEAHENSIYGVQEKIRGEGSVTFRATSRSGAGDEECHPEEEPEGAFHATLLRTRPEPESFRRDSGEEASSAGPSYVPIPASLGVRAATFRDYAMNVDGAANSPEHALRDPERNVCELVSSIPSQHNKTEDQDEVQNLSMVSLPSYALPR